VWKRQPDPEVEKVLVEQCDQVVFLPHDPTVGTGLLMSGRVR
jgi:hypothetical protein